MMRYGSICFASLAAFAVMLGAATQSDASIAVDGYLGEFGITINSSGKVVYDETAYGGYSQSPPGDGPGVRGSTTFGGLTISYHLEDSRDDRNDYQVGPLYGGQNYDAEAMVVAYHDNLLHIGIVSGQRPDNASDARPSSPKVRLYGPGDIFIQTSAGTTYGIEVGGGAGGNNSPPEELTDDDEVLGWHYNLDTSSGYTDSSAARDPVDGTTVYAGSLWKTPWEENWIPGIIGKPFQLVGGVWVGQADYSFKFGPDYGQHSIIELTISLDEFVGVPTYIRWGPACENDEVYIPEPASFAVWGLLALSFGGCGWWWRRRGR